MAESATEAIAENVAGLLCYVFGWITGLIFFLMDKRPFVRFHAAQSMVVFGGLSILYFILGRMFFGGFWAGGFGFFSLVGFVMEAAELLGLVLWVVLMVKAYQGVRYKVPVLGDIAENIAGR